MGWATFAIEKLQRGETAQIRPSGHSMTGRVNHKDLVTLAPCNPDDLAVGDIVLVRVKGNVYLHLVKAVDNHKRFLIGNNQGKDQRLGWPGRHLWHRYQHRAGQQEMTTGIRAKSTGMSDPVTYHVSRITL